MGLRFACLSGHLDVMDGSLQAKLMKAPLNNTMRDQKGLGRGNNAHGRYSLTTHLERNDASQQTIFETIVFVYHMKALHN